MLLPHNYQRLRTQQSASRRVALSSRPEHTHTRKNTHSPPTACCTRTKLTYSQHDGSEQLYTHTATHTNTHTARSECFGFQTHLHSLPAPLPVFGVVSEPPHVHVGFDDFWPQDEVFLILSCGDGFHTAVEPERLGPQLKV